MRCGGHFRVSVRLFSARKLSHLLSCQRSQTPLASCMYGVGFDAGSQVPGGRGVGLDTLCDAVDNLGSEAGRAGLSPAAAETRPDQDHPPAEAAGGQGDTDTSPSNIQDPSTNTRVPPSIRSARARSLRTLRAVHESRPRLHAINQTTYLFMMAADETDGTSTLTSCSA